jgi:cardiolipin synthase
MDSIGWAVALCLSILHALGLVSALHAVLNARTASGAIAWSISLFTFPYVALPLYWVLSRQKFYGYVKLLRDHSLIHNRYREVEEFMDRLQTYKANRAHDASTPSTRVLERLADLPFTRGNKVKLLIDGADTFETMFREIDAAEDYILVLFYIIADDEIGNEFKRRLLAKVDEGVRVYVLYDELGCMTFLSQEYIDDMRKRGVEMHPFYTTRGGFNKLQYNFRNHRKIMIVDGKVALTGGINVSDDSCGRSKYYGNWRDTHTIAWGPVVQNIQFVWAEDYYWATASLPELNWHPTPAPDSYQQNALYVPAGPASNLPSGVLFFVHCIQQAKDRLWMASPYFIPDPSVIEALILASLRGVDVRLILPERYDMLVMYLASFSSFLEIEHSGIRVFRYHTGYPHQKCMLIDNEMGWVGTSNLDNRSMRLNFEGNLVVQDEQFCREMEEMLQHDLACSVEVGPEDYYSRGLMFKLGVKVARLFAPVL